jgi:hypothetical protein
MGSQSTEFIGWYCSEPRLAFNRTVVLRYRFFLEQKNLAPATINVRLGGALERRAGSAGKRCGVRLGRRCKRPRILLTNYLK